MDKIKEYYDTLMELKGANGKFKTSKEQYVRIYHEGYSQAMDEAIETLKQMFNLGEYEK